MAASVPLKGKGFFATSVGRDVSPPVIGYSCDDRMHIDNLPVDVKLIAPGSSALVIADGSLWILRTDGEWGEV